MRQAASSTAHHYREIHKRRYRENSQPSRFRHSETEPQPPIYLPKFRDGASTIPLITSPGIIDSMFTTLHLMDESSKLPPDTLTPSTRRRAAEFAEKFKIEPRRRIPGLPLPGSSPTLAVSFFRRLHWFGWRRHWHEFLRNTSRGQSAGCCGLRGLYPTRHLGLVLVHSPRSLGSWKTVGRREPPADRD